MKRNARSVSTVFVDHSLGCFGLGIFLTVLFGYGVTKLYVQTDYTIFFSDDDPNLIAFQELTALYGKADNILVVVDPVTDDVFTPEVLSAIEQLTEMAWQIPYTQRVDSITNFQHPRVDGDNISIDSLVENALALSPQELADKKNTATNEIGLVGRLISNAGDVAAVNVTLQLPDDATEAIGEAVAKAREIQTELEKLYPSVAIYMAGIAATENVMGEVTAADGQTLIPLMFIVVLLLLSILLRSLMATICVVVVILVSVIIGMGFAGWIGLGLNNVNISAPTIIMTLAIADCVHIFSAFLRQYGQSGEKREALIQALSANIYPIFLTTITTAFGFLTMNFSESPPFRELGTIACVGVFAAFFASILILPAIIKLLPFSRRKNETEINRFTGQIAKFVSVNHTPTLWVSSALILATLVFLPRLELSDDPIGYFSENVPVRQAADFVEETFSGSQIVYYSLDTKHPDGVLEPEFLATAERFTQWLRGQAGVVNVESFTDVLKRFNQILNEDQAAFYRLPTDRASAAQYFLLYELSLPYGLDLGNQVSTDKSSLKISVILKNQNSNGLIAFDQRVQQWLQDNASQLAIPGASHSMSFARIGQRNIESMLAGSLTAIVLISLSLIVAFRSMKYGMLSFVPNLFPALVTLGIWGALVGEVNMAASVVFSLTLGIIVDDTVHFMTKYINAMRSNGGNSHAAVSYAFETVSGALLSTTVVLSAGFAVLVFSDFTINSVSGYLVGTTIWVALLLDFFFLPSLLIKLEGRKQVQSKS